MLRQRRGALWGITAAVIVIGTTPFMMGQGCTGPLDVLTRNPSSIVSGSTTPTSGTGNVPPSFSFTSPTFDISREVNQIIQISWTLSDPDSNATVQILLDPDGTFGNGNEIVIVPLVLESSGVVSYNLDPSALSLAPASYRVIAKVNDGVNPEVLVVAPGNILLYGNGLLIGNHAPSITTTLPNQNIGASQGDTVTIAWCGRDSDDGEGNVVPDVVVLLDEDSDPNNDLDLSGSTGASTLTSICQGGLPKKIPGAIVLSCTKDNDCTSTANATSYVLNVDVGLYPPLASGDPYRVRALMWDHTNKPVNSYAPGSIGITALGSGVVDLAQVGRTISGAKFQGFSAGDNAGSSGLGVGDIDGDGTDDFVIVARYGSPGGLSNVGSGGSLATGNIGSAYLVFGQAKQKFAGVNSLNSVSVIIRGTYMPLFGAQDHGCIYVGATAIPGLTGTEGITSVARVEDVTGDGRPEIAFGLPYVEQFFDYVEDDPCDCGCGSVDTATGCLKWQGAYFDGMPNPLSNTGDCGPNGCAGQPVDPLGSYDEWEIAQGGCPAASNDLDDTKFTPINGGYALMVGSDNTFDYSEIGLNLVGQVTGGSGDTAQWSGARWRGPWFDDFDLTQTKRSTSIIPDNRFGQTVNSMPSMLDTRVDISPRYGTTFLISAPNAVKGKGLVYMFSGQNWTKFNNSTNSFPLYGGCVGSCGDYAIVGRPLDTPGYSPIQGADVEDHLGYAAAAGDYNLDGSRDILMGAPGANRVVNGRFVQHGGIVYILFGRRDFGGYDLGKSNPPRMEIRGTNDNDQFGLVQSIVGDINQDGLPDIGFSTPYADGPGGVDSGFIGIVFGGRQLTGENIFTVNQVGTAQLPGCKIYGSQINGHAGWNVSNVGDFNGDGIDDLLISAPDETRIVNGQTRKGLAYLIFGGTHLVNASVSLSQIGTAQLPGALFITPYASGSADEAGIDSVASAGDVNGDGFADILLGVSKADFVNPLEPTQRRIDSGEMYLIYGSNAGSNALR